MGPKPVYKPRESALKTLFGRRRGIIGVVHSRPLPGSPSYDGEPMTAIYDYAVAEAERYAAGGMDAVIVENHGDIPFLKPDALGHETAAAMAVMAETPLAKTVAWAPPSREARLRSSSRKLGLPLRV